MMPKGPLNNHNLLITILAKIKVKAENNKLWISSTLANHLKKIGFGSANTLKTNLTIGSITPVMGIPH